jgi:hypothetical protein
LFLQFTAARRSNRPAQFGVIARLHEPLAVFVNDMRIIDACFPPNSLLNLHHSIVMLNNPGSVSHRYLRNQKKEIAVPKRGEF